MATSLSSPSSSRIVNPKSRAITTLKRVGSCSLNLPWSIRSGYPKLSCSSLSSTASTSKVEPRNMVRVSVNSAVVDEENMVEEEEIYKKEEEVIKNEEENVDSGKELMKKQPRPCELYVCNLPRSCDIAELVEMFKPFGTVLSVEVSRNSHTGISRGCGYVTMGSINSAKVAIAALDGSDIGGREMRVRFAVDMNRSRNLDTLHSSPKKNIIYESPYKVYVGNLAWNVKPEDLRNLFTQFGTVVSAKVLQDQRAGNNRIYGFLSFSSAAERDASISLNGTEFRGRTLIVRESFERTERTAISPVS